MKTLLFTLLAVAVTVAAFPASAGKPMSVTYPYLTISEFHIGFGARMGDEIESALKDASEDAQARIDQPFALNIGGQWRFARYGFARAYVNYDWSEGEAEVLGTSENVNFEGYDGGLSVGAVYDLGDNFNAEGWIGYGHARNDLDVGPYAFHDSEDGLIYGVSLNAFLIGGITTTIGYHGFDVGGDREGDQFKDLYEPEWHARVWLPLGHRTRFQISYETGTERLQGGLAFALR